MNNPKILIALPMLSTVDARFMSSLMGIQRIGTVRMALEIDSLVYMARNKLALKAIMEEFDYIFFIDSDEEFKPDTLVKLYETAQQGKDYVTGLYFKRTFPTEPVIQKRIEWERDKETGKINVVADTYTDYPRDSVFEIEGSGLGCTLIKTDIIKKVVQKFAISAFDPLPSFGEDFSFCWRLKQLGIKMWCDSRVKVGHIGTFVYDEDSYLKQLKEGDL